MLSQQYGQHVYAAVGLLVVAISKASMHAPIAQCKVSNMQRIGLATRESPEWVHHWARLHIALGLRLELPSPRAAVAPGQFRQRDFSM